MLQPVRVYSYTAACDQQPLFFKTTPRPPPPNFPHHYFHIKQPPTNKYPFFMTTFPQTTPGE